MDIIFIIFGVPVCWGFAFVVIYPDKALEWWYRKTGKLYGVGYLLGLEAVAIIVWATITFDPITPERPVDWAKPWLAVIFLGCMRMVLAALKTEP